MKLKLALTLAFAALACTPEQSEKAQDVKAKVGAVTDAASALAAQTREDYVKKVEAELAALDARIDALAQKATKESEETLAGLRARRAALTAQLTALKSSTGEAWQDMRSGLDNAMRELEKSAESAADRFE